MPNIEKGRRNATASGATAARIGTQTRRLVERAVRAGVTPYDRNSDLPALIRSDPFAPAPESPEEVSSVVKRLERALRAERNRARSGHWTYDLNRHIALRQAYVAERERLAAMARNKR